MTTLVAFAATARLAPALARCAIPAISPARPPARPPASRRSRLSHPYPRNLPRRPRRASVASPVRRRLASPLVRATENPDVPPEADAEDTPEARVGNAIAEFADAGFPSEEGDAVDPVSRTKAMNGAVDDLNVLMDAESEVLGQAFELLEKMGIKGLEKPPGREERDAVDEDA